MKKLHFKLTFLIVLFFLCQFSFAQNVGKISGRASDEKGALEFVDVNLKKSTDTTKTVGYTTTDAQGNFNINNIPNGDYTIRFSLIGYKTYSQKVILSDSNSSVILNSIVLKSDATLLNNVVVTGQKKTIQKTQEGFIFNASTNIAQVGGTATDLLKNIPTISVDADGAITLRGKMPLILINGKILRSLTSTKLPPAVLKVLK